MTRPATPRFTPSRQIEVCEDWLAQLQEAPPDSAMPIVDPQHHLQDRAAERYLLDDLLRDTSDGHAVRATVFVQCGAVHRAPGPEEQRPLGKTEFVTCIAAARASGTYGPMPARAGIVGVVDITWGNSVAPLLDSHVATAWARFRGMRNRTDWYPSLEVRANLLTAPPGQLEDWRFVEGVRHLGRRGLVLDIWADQTQLPHVAAVVWAVPELTAVLIHCGGPLGIGLFAGRRDDGFAAWRREPLALAALPNRVMKHGGRATEIGGHGWPLGKLPPGPVGLEQAWWAVVHILIEAFGARRCMFQDSFPVDKGSVTDALRFGSAQPACESAGDRADPRRCWWSCALWQARVRPAGGKW